MDPAIYAALAAIVAPVLTALINNRHQYRMRKLEIFQDERIRAIGSYAESCSNYIDNPYATEKSEYLRAYGKVFLYTKRKQWPAIESVHADIMSNDLESASGKLADLFQSLSADMKI